MEKRGILNKYNILNIEPARYSRKAYEILSKIGNIEEISYTKKELLKKIYNIDILIVRLKNYIDTEIIDNAVNLKYILSATTGLNHINVEYAEKKGIKIISLLGERHFLDTIPSTAEHTWALILGILKKSHAAFDSVRKGNWNRDLFIGQNIKDKKIGILGLGRVGKQVAKYALAFDCKVAAYDVDEKKSIDNIISFNDPKELFQWADIISIHIPFSDNNELFVNRELLGNLKPNTYIVNTSRGAIWDEYAILELLKSGHLAGAATDVLCDEYFESISNNPLVKYSLVNDNLLITPHIAGATLQSMEMTEIFIAQKLIAQINL